MPKTLHQFAREHLFDGGPALVQAVSFEPLAIASGDVPTACSPGLSELSHDLR